MNIDLFITGHGESGLLCDESFKTAIGGVILDAETNALTIEFTEDQDPFHLNIPVEDEVKEKMLFTHKIQVGLMEEGLIEESLQVPMFYLNDPYGSEFAGGSPMGRPSRSILGFEQFMKRCVAAQPIHREDLGDEDLAGCVLRGMDPTSLQYVPQLVRQRMLEVGPAAAAAAELSIGPSVPAPGLAPAGMGGGQKQQRTIKRRPIQRDESDQ